MQLNFNTLSPDEAYYALIQLVIPRPIAWVLSDNGNDSLNLAPFSFFNAIGANPPLLAMAISHKEDGTPKDTWANIAEREHFVVHIPPVTLANAVVQTAASLPHGESEVSLAGLSLSPVPGWPLPRVTAAPVAFLCKRDQILLIGKGKTGLIIGEALEVWVDDEAASRTGGRLSIDALKLNPLARLGGNQYAPLGELLTIKRPR
ncbi:MAG: flavin reductase family protein [Verrucomicrobiota bacterium]|nr:flavin reductase family protein [Verrucomicrobiota bacterium]